MSELRLSVGVDLGGTNARAALVDARGTILRQTKRKLPARDPASVVDVLAAAIEETQGGQKDLPVGVGVAGQILDDSGVVSVGPNLGWRDVPFAAMLMKRVGRPVSLLNDLQAAALGEQESGAAAGCKDVVLVFVGSGVGSALILGGRLYAGAMGVAGELGHTRAVPNGRRCGCGELGCLEAYVSGRNLTERVKEALAAGTPSKLLPGASATEIEREALGGDALATELFEEVVRLLSIAIGNLTTILNPSLVVLGGGVFLNGPELRRRIDQGVFEQSARVSRVGLKVTDAQLGDDAGVVGAALHALGQSASVK
jgi:glucokinase